ncbi:MAG: heavy metal translocating P-type ATPase [Catenulispora sp.]|nr:heavy metal translocating P-type ATPase [Catenulispora sp.]
MEDTRSRLRDHADQLILAAAVGGLAAGGVAWCAGAHGAAHVVWGGVAVLGVLCSLTWVLAALRERRLDADVIALLALVGTLLVHEELAGALITVMLAGGRALEAAAAGRARRDLRALLARAPRTVRRRVGGAVGSAESTELTGSSELTVPSESAEPTTVETVPAEAVRPGDIVIVGAGEVVPVDGTLAGGAATLDESALTGEPLPVEYWSGDRLRSGVLNAGAPFDLRATSTAADGTYAGILRLVREAEQAKAPAVRAADRIAAWFLPLTLIVCGLAWWLSGEARRAVAVLVVATPCPLILAVPVAMVAGLSLTARRGVVVKGGGVLERLADVRTLIVDKTGTLTAGRPTLGGVVTAEDVSAEEVLRLAASLDQVSAHVLAAAVVRAAHERGLRLSAPRDAEEITGQGMRGYVEGREVHIGKAAFAGDPGDPGAAAWAETARRRSDADGALTVFIGVDGRAVGVLLFDDPVRPDSARTIRALRRGGVRRVVMATGDRRPVAEAVGSVTGVDEVFAECGPEFKADLVRAERAGAVTGMVGDGVNDAPALALADVGVAVGAGGTTASSEAADVVLTVDRLERLAEAMTVARRTKRIALQSAGGGMAASGVAMLVAALGHLPAAWGALLQEGIDLAAILNALRVLRPDEDAVRLDDRTQELARRFAAEHTAVWAVLDRMRAVADDLADQPTDAALGRVRQLHRDLVEDVLPHEEAEEELLYPAMAEALGGVDPMATMSRAHVEIQSQIRALGNLVRRRDLGAADIAELRLVLYGLYAVLRLHTLQEEESYLSLADVPGPAEDTAEPAA